MKPSKGNEKPCYGILNFSNNIYLHNLRIKTYARHEKDGGADFDYRTKAYGIDWMKLSNKLCYFFKIIILRKYEIVT